MDTLIALENWPFTFRLVPFVEHDTDANTIFVKIAKYIHLNFSAALALVLSSREESF